MSQHSCFLSSSILTHDDTGRAARSSDRRFELKFSDHTIACGITAKLEYGLKQTQDASLHTGQWERTQTHSDSEQQRQTQALQDCNSSTLQIHVTLTWTITWLVSLSFLWKLLSGRVTREDLTRSQIYVQGMKDIPEKEHIECLSTC